MKIIGQEKTKTEILYPQGPIFIELTEEMSLRLKKGGYIYLIRYEGRIFSNIFGIDHFYLLPGK